MKKFEANVAYLQRNVPPDDIYVFAEQTFLAAVFFITKWAEWVDVTEEMEKDPNIDKWVTNIVGFQMKKDLGVDVNLDLSFGVEE